MNSLNELLAILSIVVAIILVIFYHSPIYIPYQKNYDGAWYLSRTTK